MSAAEQLPWHLIEVAAPEAERLTVRLAAPSRSKDVFIAVDRSKRRHLLVEIPVGEPAAASERTSKGVSLQTVELRAEDGEGRTYIEIACLDVQGHTALDTIAFEIISALESGSSIKRVRLIQNILAKWRRFWSGVDHGLLSREEQIGLFGELWFLQRWLIPAIELPLAIEMWRGPLGSRNDFEAPKVGIEVKATGRQVGVHTINGLEQLIPPDDGDLFLFSLSLRDEASGSFSLPTLVQTLRALIGGDHVSHSKFDRILYSAGYDDRLSAEYAKLSLRVRSEYLFSVSGNFPRLIPSSLKAPLPIGISNIRYELALDPKSDVVLADNPATATAILQRTIKK